jgi:hypothetical protein
VELKFVNPAIKDIDYWQRKGSSKCHSHPDFLGEKSGTLCFARSQVLFQQRFRTGTSVRFAQFRISDLLPVFFHNMDGVIKN